MVAPPRWSSAFVASSVRSVSWLLGDVQQSGADKEQEEKENQNQDIQFFTQFSILVLSCFGLLPGKS